MIKLPNKPSELLRLAIHDPELCDKDSRYVIDMRTWHSTSGGLCAICLAGAYLAKTHKSNPKKDINHYRLNRNIKKMIFALDDFRMGDLVSGLIYFGLPWEKVKLFIGRMEGEGVVRYEYDPTLFKQQMLDLADIFEVEGM